MKYLLSLVVIALLSSCASAKMNSLKISNGDTKESVIKAMGTPEDRQFKGTFEAWQYAMVVSIGVCDYTVIWFEISKVVGLTQVRHLGFSKLLIF